MKKIFLLSCTIFIHLSAMDSDNNNIRQLHQAGTSRIYQSLDSKYKDMGWCCICDQDISGEKHHLIRCPQSNYDHLIEHLKNIRTIGTISHGKQNWLNSKIAYDGAKDICARLLSAQNKFGELYPKTNRVTGYDRFYGNFYRCNICSFNNRHSRLSLDQLIDHVIDKKHKENVLVYEEYKKAYEKWERQQVAEILIALRNSAEK